MQGLTWLCFVFMTRYCLAGVVFPNVVETALADLRYKRDASCGGEVDLSGGSETIQLQTEIFNGTEFYRVKEDCTWTVKTSPSQHMIITSEYFRLELSDNCMFDYVEIKESDGVTNRYCGWDTFTYITTSDEISIRFKSDISYEDKGFKFLLESKQIDAEVSKCNSSIVGGDDSNILNNDERGASCFYRIQAPGDKVVELDLKMLDFGSHSCNEESILVYDGLTNQGKPLATICSDSLQQVQPYHMNTVFIVYRNPLEQEGERFQLDYSFVEDNFTPAPTPPTTPSPVGGNNDCSGMFKGIDTDNGEMIYTAPEYEDNKDCVVVVRNILLPRHVVQIEFLYFDTEDSDNCMFDSLMVKSGERHDSGPLGGPYCGESLNGRTLLSAGNSLRLEFKTDQSFSLRGFQAKISFVPNKDCTCEGNQLCIRQDYEKKCVHGNHCTANICQNGGTCIRSGSTQTCYCQKGFQGDDCSDGVGGSSFRMHFTVAPINRFLKRGEGYVEQCAVEVPDGEEVVYDWTLNGALIEAYSSSSGFGTHPHGVLQIDDFTDQIEGQYSCFATTASGTAEHTFEYTIVEDCDVRIYPGPQTTSVKINENALLMCYVSRAIEVRWKKDGVYIDYDSNPKFKKMVNNYLEIRDVGLDDAGTYQCEAEDRNGCYSYKEGTLTVVDVKPLNQYCGISIHDEVALASGRISKGKDARPNENPWHVMIRSSVNVGMRRTFCGGTLISQRYILTAAHCIEEFEDNMKVPWNPTNVVFMFGTTHCNEGDHNATTRTFRSYTVHPEFQKRSLYDSDIALIELDSPVEYTDAVRPICLEPADYNDRVFLEDSASLSPVPGKVVGCGRTRTSGGTVTFLQEIHLPYVRREECKESLEKTKYSITDMMFCAGSNIARTGDTCSGDSGGGLVMATSTRWVQTGIVSWGLGCDKSIYYGVYTNVGMFYNWIEDIAKFSEEEVPDFLIQN